MTTTAGIFALFGSVVLEDAEVVMRLRKAGAIIIGKTKISCHGYRLLFHIRESQLVRSQSIHLS